MQAAIGAAVSWDAEAAPEKLEFALAVAAGNALQIEIAAAGTVGTEHVANGDLGAVEAPAAFAATPGAKAEDTDSEVAHTAAMRAATGSVIATGTDHRFVPSIGFRAGRIGSFVIEGK
jgi:hypothetical protein